MLISLRSVRKRGRRCSGCRRAGRSDAVRRRPSGAGRPRTRSSHKLRDMLGPADRAVPALFPPALAAVATAAAAPAAATGRLAATAAVATAAAGAAAAVATAVLGPRRRRPRRLAAAGATVAGAMAAWGPPGCGFRPPWHWWNWWW